MSPIKILSLSIFIVEGNFMIEEKQSIKEYIKNLSSMNSSLDEMIEELKGLDDEELE